MTQKNKSLLLTAILIVLATIIVWLLLPKRKLPLPGSTPRKLSGASEAVSSISTPNSKRHEPETRSEHASVSEEQAEQQKAKIIKQAMEREQVPLDFFGRVVDETGQGVAGSVVQVSSSHFDLLRPDDLSLGGEKLTVQTDSQGDFSIKGLRGYSLVIRVGKEGYFTSSRNPSGFNYVGDPKLNFRADPQKPVIFRLVQKKGAEPLLYHRYKAYKLPHDGNQLFVDLVTARTNSPDPDLKVQLWTDEKSKDSNFRYDWRVKVEVIDGGIQESQEEFDFIAPETGYSPFVELEYPRSLGDNWKRNTRRKFLLKLRGGRIYGRMTFGVVPGGERFCEVEAWLNPSGPRNLEPDPNLQFSNSDAYNAHMAKQKQATK